MQCVHTFHYKNAAFEYWTSILETYCRFTKLFHTFFPKDSRAEKWSLSLFKIYLMVASHTTTTSTHWCWIEAKNEALYLLTAIRITPAPINGSWVTEGGFSHGALWRHSRESSESGGRTAAATEAASAVTTKKRGSRREWRPSLLAPSKSCPYKCGKTFGKLSFAVVVPKGCSVTSTKLQVALLWFCLM